MSNTSSTTKTARKTLKNSIGSVAGTSKLESLVTMLRQPTGARMHELAAAATWRTNSVRGELAGTLKKKGHSINSDVIEGVRRYRIEEPQT